MSDALKDPGVRAVLRVVGGALSLLAGLFALALADGRTLRVVVAVVVMVGAAVTIVAGIRAYRREGSRVGP